MTKPHCTPFPDYLELDSTLSEEQKLIKSSVREMVKKELLPKIKDNNREATFPKDAIKKIADLGLLGCNLNGYGLSGLDQISYGLVMRELERCDSGIRSFASVQGSLVMYPIWAFGSEEQKNMWLPKLASADAIGCFGLTEADGGSDPGAMKTTAEKTPEGWIINGSKMWITNGNIAQLAVIWAKTNEGVRGFLIPTDTKGFTAKKMYGKLSLRASETAELYFDNVKLPDSAALEKSSGLKSALACLTQARYGITWGVIGAAEACFDEASRYVKDRILFGKPLAAKQMIQRKLSLMLSSITKAQLLAYQLGELKNKGKLHFAQVSMGKQSNCQMALEVAREARDILGANGTLDEYNSMRHANNLETVITYEGTNDIHLLIMGEQITGIAAF